MWPYTMCSVAVQILKNCYAIDIKVCSVAIYKINRTSLGPFCFIVVVILQFNGHTEQDTQPRLSVGALINTDLQFSSWTNQ